MMPDHNKPDKMALPERLTHRDSVRQGEALLREAGLQPMLNAAPNIVLVLNEQRQIIYANRALLSLIGLDDTECVCGLRPGEVLDCVHASESDGGCGSTEFCSTCGIMKAAISSLRKQERVEECRITLKNGDALDLLVWATPLQLGDRTFSVFAIQDISHDKRRRALERIFFHDILNTAGGVRGLAHLLASANARELDHLRERIVRLSSKLVEEIATQRELLAAETGDLQVQLQKVRSLALLREVHDNYRDHPEARDKVLLIDPASPSVEFTSDETLLRRVLCNMVKNALEASQAGETVTMGCAAQDHWVEFRVHNPAVIPYESQLQIFQRSFSTKGAGRGLGTYSIKLLTERYLKGQVGFKSADGTGTTFFVRYPVTYPAPMD